MKLEIGCVLLAAGLGTRFGGKKLLAELDGKSLVERAMDLIDRQELSAVAVVSAGDEILQMAAGRGYKAIRNPRPEEGISGSIKLGVKALERCDSLLFMVGDQPLLKSETVAAILQQGEKYPEQIIVPEFQKRMGNPCLFPSLYYPDLLALEGDKGGKQIIGAHSSQVIRVDVSGDELLDVDTPECLERLRSGHGFPGGQLSPRIKIYYYTGDKAFGPGLAELIRLVRELGSLRAATATTGIAYSKAWSVFKQSEEALGFKLLKRSTGGKNGGGAVLTEEAEKLLALYDEYCRRMQDEGERMLQELLPLYFLPEEACDEE